MDTKDNNVVVAAAELAACKQQPILPPDDVTGAPVVIVPQGYQVAVPPGWEPAKPSRIKQTFRTPDLTSFIEYLRRNGVPSISVIYAAVTDTGASLRGVIDAHGTTGGADWQSHQVLFQPKATLEWNRWVGASGKAMTQTEFAQFIETNALDVINPTGADLLHICNEFEVEGAVQYQKIQRLQSGAIKFTYTDEKTAKAGGVEVPEVFTLGVRIFEGTSPLPVQARFRYRLKQGGELVLWFELVNPHIHIRNAVAAMVEAVKAASVGQVFVGEI